jgi:hypothetical protein
MVALVSWIPDGEPPLQPGQAPCDPTIQPQTIRLAQCSLAATVPAVFAAVPRPTISVFPSGVRSFSGTSTSPVEQSSGIDGQQFSFKARCFQSGLGTKRDRWKATLLSLSMSRSAWSPRVHCVEFFPRHEAVSDGPSLCTRPPFLAARRILRGIAGGGQLGLFSDCTRFRMV